MTILIGVGCSSSTSTSTSTSQADSPSSWKQVWADNFNGPANSSVNASNWTYVDGHGDAFFGTGEVETTTSSPDNIRLDGHGDLELVVVGQGAAGRPGSGWTAARRRTKRLFAAPAGGEMMVIATLKQPDPAHALGYWPAWGMARRSSCAAARRYVDLVQRWERCHRGTPAADVGSLWRVSGSPPSPGAALRKGGKACPVG